MSKNLYKINKGCHCNMDMNNSFCRIPEFMPLNPMLANSYVPYQRLNEIYTPQTALAQGTIFPELDMPYTSGQGYMQLMELYEEGGA